jgi:hypothetical protein
VVRAGCGFRREETDEALERSKGLDGPAQGRRVSERAVMGVSSRLEIARKTSPSDPQAVGSSAVANVQPAVFTSRSDVCVTFDMSGKLGENYSPARSRSAKIPRTMRSISTTREVMDMISFANQLPRIVDRI